MNLYLRVAPHDGDCRFYSRRAACEIVASEGLRCAEPIRVGLWAYFISATKSGAGESA